IIAIGAGVSIFMRYIRQPLMIGYILTGILVGPAILQVLESPQSLTTFGNLGIALLLFIIGLGMNPRVVSEVGRSSVITAVSHMSITGLIAWFVSVGLGLTHREALFIAIGLTINSTIVALKLLSDRKEVGRLYGKLTVGVSLVEDIIAAVLLLMVASASGGQWLTAGPLMGLVFKGALIGAAMFFVSRVLLPKAQKLVASDQELLFLTAIAIGLGSAALFAKIGLSLEVGALAAGVMLASMPYAQEIASRLRPLRDFFIIVFFIALGTELTFNQFGELFWLLVAGAVTVVVIKPIIIMTILGMLGYTKRTSFKTALALSQVSEFSIIFLILANQKGLVGHDMVVLLTFIALVSIAASTYLVTFSDQLYAKFENYLDLFERHKALSDVAPAEPNELVLFGYQRGGHEFVNLFKAQEKIRRHRL
ncbi:cation:proton antiporter, partial [Candidatus Saccharibacteria bacterium]|nr:cation:proton antiporter [Candidatus Saccharibacteria bacterium]